MDLRRSVMTLLFCLIVISGGASILSVINLLYGLNRTLPCDGIRCPLKSSSISSTQRQRVIPKPVLALFPEDVVGLNSSSRDRDRIVNQLTYVPPENLTRPLTILLLGDHLTWGPEEEYYDFSQCAASQCQISKNFQRDFHVADVVLWHWASSTKYWSSQQRAIKRASPQQIWAVQYYESPKHANGFDFPGLNWSLTYRTDSTIPSPYNKFILHTELTHHTVNATLLEATLNTTVFNREGRAAIVVSNCYSWRLEMVRELGRHFPVDIYGNCGTRSCSKDSSCFEMLNKKYKFYLAFENSKCRDYITEKLFDNALQHDMVPVVLGAHPDDYARQAPPKSYIHVEQFATIEELAKYLRYLHENYTAYGEYFSWKSSGYFLGKDTRLLCRLCGMAHEAVLRACKGITINSLNEGAELDWRNSCIPEFERWT